MSMTFYAKSLFSQDARCIVCKAMWTGQDCEAGCQYGYYPATGDISFNVSNSNARLILAAVGLDMGDDCALEFDPATALAGIAQNRGRVSEFTRSTQIDGNFINCGYGEDALTCRLEQLAALCHVAMEEGTTIVVV